MIGTNTEDEDDARAEHRKVAAQGARTPPGDRKIGGGGGGGGGDISIAMLSMTTAAKRTQAARG